MHCKPVIIITTYRECDRGGMIVAVKPPLTDKKKNLQRAVASIKPSV